MLKVMLCSIIVSFMIFCCQDQPSRKNQSTIADKEEKNITSNNSQESTIKHVSEKQRKEIYLIYDLSNLMAKLHKDKSFAPVSSQTFALKIIGEHGIKDTNLISSILKEGGVKRWRQIYISEDAHWALSKKIEDNNRMPTYNEIVTEVQKMIKGLHSYYPGMNILLFEAINNNNIEKAKELLSQTADVNALSRDGNTPLTLAVQKNDTAFVKFLLQHGADINRGGLKYPIHQAAAKGNLEMVKLLVKNGARISQRDSQIDKNALEWAILYKNYDVANYLRGL